LPPRSSRRFSTAGSQNEIRVGSVWIVPTGDNPGPSAFGIFTFQSNGKIVSTAGIPALVPRSKLRVFVEASGNFRGGDSGSTMTGLAISNPSENPVTVSYTLRYLNGATARTSSSLIPARSQTSLFLRELPGFESLQTPLQGVLEVNSSAGKIAVVGIRARFNERGDFLFAATPPIDEEDMSRRRLFAHLVDGGGYSTQIVLLPALTNRNATGAIYFFSSSGKPWSLILR
jgi:hypothetical protein